MLLIAALAALAVSPTTSPAQGTPPPPRQATADGGTRESAGARERTFSPTTLRRRPPVGAPALYGGWRSCAIGGGGAIGRVSYTADPRVLYAHAIAGGIYRSDDAGRRWRMLHGALPTTGAPAVRDLSVDPKDPNRVLALVGAETGLGAGAGTGAAQGLYETVDGGRTWRKTLVLEVDADGPLHWSGSSAPRSRASAAR